MRLTILVIRIVLLLETMKSLSYPFTQLITEKLRLQIGMHRDWIEEEENKLDDK